MSATAASLQAHMLYPKKWVSIKAYCALTGETEKAITRRREKGIWLDGRHTTIGPNGRLWVNLIEADKWVESGNQ